MKETIIDLLTDVKAKGFWEYGTDRNTGEKDGHDMTAEDIADYLLENGVTVQRWISVKDRLPDDFSAFLCRVIRPIRGGTYVRETRILWCDYDKSWNCEGIIVTHWMELPEPPEGE
jgi:hypothetical protein